MKNAGMVIGLFVLACGGATVLATSITRSVLAARQQQADEDTRQLRDKIAALERKIESLEGDRLAVVRDSNSYALIEDSSSVLSDPLPRAASSAPAAATLPADNADGGTAPPPRPQTVDGESVMREIVNKVLQEKEDERAQQREEQQKQRQIQHLDRMAQQLELQDPQKAIFREVMLAYEQKVRDTARMTFQQGGMMDETTRQSFQATMTQLRQERDQKLAPYLLPTQIQKLTELEGNRGPRPDGGGGRQR